MPIYKQIFVTLFLLLIILCVFEFSDLDIYCQDFFYNTERHEWLIDKDYQIFKILFYTGPKVLLFAFGIACFLMICLSSKINLSHSKRWFCILMLLSFIFVPLTIAILKNITNIYTPAQIIRYGGDKPYVKIFQKYPKYFHQNSYGKGWPAGHASGGFALMMFYFVFEKKRQKIAGLLAGLSAG